MRVTIVPSRWELPVLSGSYRAPAVHRAYTWPSSAKLLWSVLLFLVMDALGTARPALAIGTTPPTWKPRETVTDTLASHLYHTGSDRTLAYDHHGNPGIAFSNDVDNDLHYARHVPGVGWVHTVVDDGISVGRFPSLAYDRYERPAISYFDSFNNDLKYAHFNGAGWQLETIADSADAVGLYTSLSFDMLGRPAIAYRAVSDSALKYVADTDGDLSLMDEMPVTVANEFGDGDWAALVYDPLNRPMIAHTNTAAPFGVLRFSIEEPGLGWVTTTIDDSGDTGYTSIAIDPDTGYPAIAFSYSELGLGYLRFAAWDGDSWNSVTVDSSGNAGYFPFPSLAFDPADGNPAIAYRDESTDDLKLAWYDGTSWQTQTVDAVGNVGLTPSLAFNDYGTGFPSIAYFDAGSGGTGHLYFIDDPPAAVPEPGSLVAWLLGVASLSCRRQLVRR